MAPRSLRFTPVLRGALPALAALALALPTAAPLRAQSPDGPVADDLPPVEAPPELRAHHEQKVERLVKALRNSNAEARAEVEREIVEYGRGALPLLLDAATTDHEGKQAGILACLEALVDLRDRVLVRDLTESDQALLRRFAARRAGVWLWGPLLTDIPPLLADPDAQVRQEAALALLASGDPAGLEVLLAQATEPTGKDVTDADRARAAALEQRVLAVLPALADKGAHPVLERALVLDPERHRDDPDAHAATRRAAVRMLGAVGDDAAVSALFVALDDPHNLVQRDAIDALRRLLEDAAPFEGGSIFAQINEIERIKGLRGTRR